MNQTQDLGNVSYSVAHNEILKKMTAKELLNS